MPLPVVTLTSNEEPRARASRIKASYQVNIKERSNWTTAFEWMNKSAENFQVVFSKYV